MVANGEVQKDFLPDKDDDEDDADNDSADENEEDADNADNTDDDNADKDDNEDDDNADEDDNADDVDDNDSPDKDGDEDDADNAKDDNADYANDEGSLLTPAPIYAQVRPPTDDDDGEDSVHRANNTIEEDEIERENEDDHEIGVNPLEIEDLDFHGSKWQAYIQEKEQLLESEFSVVKEPHKVKLGVGA
jgi:hypothetical protein